jgi:acyl phosphate:glycerol-3-phosphate acyltransferase
MITDILWILGAYVCGTLPLAYWIGQAVMRQDIRAVGDGNPGSTNFFKAGGKKYMGWGIIAMLLEVFKVMMPVMFGAYWAGLAGWSLVALALAPVVGNAFTPFLKFRGSKSIAAILGMWGGLTFFIIPSALGILFFVWIKIIKHDAWGILLAYLTILVAFVVLRSDWTFFAIWFGSFAILVYKWREKLRTPPDFQKTIFGKLFPRHGSTE